MRIWTSPNTVDIDKSASRQSSKNMLSGRDIDFHVAQPRSCVDKIYWTSQMAGHRASGLEKR